MLHLRNAVLPDSDGCGERGLGVTGIFPQFSKTVLRNLAIHLFLDCVDAGTVARTATAKIIERGHRFFPFFVFGLATVAAAACFIFCWCSVNRRSAMGTFVAYHFVQFPALSPATSMIARDWMSKAKSTRMWAPPLVGARSEFLHVRVRRSFEGVHEWPARNRSVFLQLLQRRDQVVVLLVVEAVDPCFNEG